MRKGNSGCRVLTALSAVMFVIGDSLPPVLLRGTTIWSIRRRDGARTAASNSGITNTIGANKKSDSKTE